MPRIRFSTRIDGDLLKRAKERAALYKLDGANSVIEDALRLYFSYCQAEIWERELQGGWIKKLVVRPEKIMFESIRSRKVNTRYNPKYYTEEALQAKGWCRVWKCRKA